MEINDNQPNRHLSATDKSAPQTREAALPRTGGAETLEFVPAAA